MHNENQPIPESTEQLCVKVLRDGLGLRECELSVMPSPQQEDGCNCGVFVAVNVWHLVHGRELSASLVYFQDGEGARAMRCNLARSLIMGSVTGKGVWPRQ